MDDQEKGQPASGLQRLFQPVVVLLLTGLFVGQVADLSGKRPTIDKERTPSSGIQLDARLWTDPFDAARQDVKSEPKHETNKEDLGGQLAAHVLDGAGDSVSSQNGASNPGVVILGVFVDGGPYFESTETRRRTRYAVVSGLASSGYEPEDAEHIRYLSFANWDYYDPPEQLVLSQADRRLPDVLPYEWFRPSPDFPAAGRSKRPVLVLWLDESALSQRPLRKLSVMNNQLRYYAMQSVYRTGLPRITDIRSGCQRMFPSSPLLDGAITASLFAVASEECASIVETHGADQGAHDQEPTVREACRRLQQVIQGKNETLSKTTPAQTGQAGPPAVDESLVRKHENLIFQVWGHHATDLLDSLASQISDAVKSRPETYLGPAECRRDPTAVFDASSYDFRILGPASSGVLIEMIRELHVIPRNETAGSAGRPEAPVRHEETAVNRYFPFRIYSPRASASDKELLHTAYGIEDSEHEPTDSEYKIRRGLSAYFADKGIPYLRTLLQDDELAESLLKEIDRRGVNLGSGHEVALIAESDTAYARRLTRTFCEQLRIKDAQCETLRYSYLRGLDGEGASKSGRPNDREKNHAQDASQSLNEAIERIRPASLDQSWGDDQIDYLRRIASNIDLHDRQLRAEWPPRSIRAIGLLGNDVYDKILILRALRESFPETIFFTTDLDARFTDGGAQNGSTRNLVVASSYGLELAPECQHSIPSFRDTYQTSYFLATQTAMGGACRIEAGAMEQWKPKLFEIGRTQAVLLSEGNETPAAAACGDDQRRDQASCTTPPTPRSWLTAYRLTALIVLVAVIGWSARFVDASLTGIRSRRPEIPPVGTLFQLFIDALAMASLFLVLYLCARHIGAEEPLSWFEGVSIWPTEFIRFAALLLTCYFLCGEDVHDDLRQTLQEAGLASALRPPSGPDSRNSLRLLSARFLRCRPSASDAGVLGAILLGFLVVQYLERLPFQWRPYFALFAALLPLGAWWLVNRLSDRSEVGPPRATFEQNRMLLYTSILAAAAVTTIVVFGVPVVPYRGAASKFIDCVILSLLILMFLSLLGRVIEASRTVNFWLHQLISDANRQPATVWSDRIKAIGTVTQYVRSMIFHPFIIAALLTVARSPVFDNWSMPLGLVLVLLVSFVLLLACGYAIKWPAGEFRDLALETLRNELQGRTLDAAMQTRSEHGHSEARIVQLNVEISKVESFNAGAYGSILQSPIAQGLLVFASGGGLFAALPNLLGNVLG